MLELACAGPLAAALFTCTEGAGITIITDSPAQLSRCRPLSESPSPTGNERPHHPTSVREPVPIPSNPIELSQLASSPKEHTVRPASISVPLERLGSLFVVTIQVNKTLFARLILDTGARTRSCRMPLRASLDIDGLLGFSVLRQFEVTLDTA